MALNNFMPRLCGFIVAALLSTIVFMTTWNTGIECSLQIQLFAAFVLIVWLVLLFKAKGCMEYRHTEILMAGLSFLLLGLFFSDIWSYGTISNTPIVAVNQATDGIHRDTLAHTAMASGIMNYGYPSLLINTDAFYNYYTGSHAIMVMLV